MTELNTHPLTSICLSVTWSALKRHGSFLGCSQLNSKILDTLLDCLFLATQVLCESSRLVTIMSWGEAKSRQLSQEIKAAPAFRMCLHTEAFSLASQPHGVAEVPRKIQKIRSTFHVGSAVWVGRPTRPWVMAPLTAAPTLPSGSHPALPSSSIIFSHKYPPHSVLMHTFQVPSPEYFHCVENEKASLHGNRVFSNSWWEDPSLHRF